MRVRPGEECGAEVAEERQGDRVESSLPLPPMRWASRWSCVGLTGGRKRDGGEPGGVREAVLL
jgi:hypothetical protein